jgi:protein phosphatase 1B
MTDDELWVANVGDSEAVIGVRSGAQITARCLTVPHKPSQPDERQRIVAAGGVILFERLGGQMAVRGVVPCTRALAVTRHLLTPHTPPQVSRSFGDYAFKAPHNGCAENHMSVLPHIERVELTDKIEFLIVACDGACSGAVRPRSNRRRFNALARCCRLRKRFSALIV